MRPEVLRHRAIDPAAVRAGMTVPAGKSRERATGVQKPVVSEGMTKIPNKTKCLPIKSRIGAEAIPPQPYQVCIIISHWQH
ncbi:hypothetical protein [Rhizobium leguminosarum]|uniref:hypothetical protein n=1 Tax=Rhizobium leguminosarum TaxID=384 RepID=UPI001FF058DA|nr:hypothetical protein [Rhizobium leguminosarum]